MKRVPTLFLKLVLILIALVVLTGLAVFPTTEGRAKHLDLISIYSDPLIIYGYLASIPFFMALFQAFKLIGYVEKNNIFTQAAVKAVKTIRYCALAIPVFIIFGEFFIVLNAKGDDFAGPVALGIYTILSSLVVAAAAVVFERIIHGKK